MNFDFDTPKETKQSLGDSTSKKYPLKVLEHNEIKIKIDTEYRIEVINLVTYDELNNLCEVLKEAWRWIRNDKLRKAIQEKE